VGTIGDIADRIDADAPDGPVLVMIGKAMAEVVARDVTDRAPLMPAKAGIQG